MIFLTTERRFIHGYFGRRGTQKIQQQHQWDTCEAEPHHPSMIATQRPSNRSLTHSHLLLVLWLLSLSSSKSCVLSSITMASSVPLSTGASDTNSRTYRGGFSTSICDLFSSRNKSDCCALACCGLLLSDRNTYLVTGTQETPPWWRRLVINLGIPLGMLLVIAQLVGRQTDPELQAQVAIRGWAVFIVVIMVLCLRGASFRYSERQLVMRELYRRRHAVDDMDEAQVQEYLRLNHRDTALSTAVCSCYPKDNGDTLSSSNQPDLCTCLWKTLAALCCGACCNCWCQCFGLCAIAQQDREIRRDNTMKSPWITLPLNPLVITVPS